MTLTIKSDADKLALIKMISELDTGSTVTIETPAAKPAKKIEKAAKPAAKPAKQVEMPEKPSSLRKAVKTRKIVMVDDINEPEQKPTLSEGEIKSAAISILHHEGITVPMILIKIGLEKYEVYTGKNIYWAARKASEIDPIKGETINAVVVDSVEEAEYLVAQAALLGMQYS